MALTNGVYYWRIAALGADGAWGLWSEVRLLIVDTVPPAKPSWKGQRKLLLKPFLFGGEIFQ